MTGPTSRFGRFLRSSMDAMLTPAENPRNRPPDPDQQQRLLLEQIHGAVANLAATRQRLETHRELIAERAGATDSAARKAIQTGRDDQARIELRRQRIALDEIEQLDRQVAALKHEEDRLAMVAQRIGARIETARAREQLAAARHSAAEVQVAVGEALSGLGAAPESAEAVDRIERDAEELELRARAIEELMTSGVLGGTASNRESSRSDADDEIERRLQALKAEAARPS